MAVVDPLTIIQGDALSSLRRLPNESVQCCVTSPPYWSLRDYGLEPIVWDQTVECDHVWGAWTEDHDERESRTSGKTRTTERFYGAASRKFDGNHQKHAAGAFCVDCGAWLGCLGLEPTPELYVSHLVQIFSEVRRVLRADGTAWINLGDSYAGGGNGGGGSFAKDGIRCAEPGTDKNKAHRYGSRGVTVKSKRIPRGSGRWGGGNAPAVGDLKPKDLIGVPWMAAFALRSSGWYLRLDIVWSKTNPMPESVSDRPTKSHEYIFLLSKSARYFYDAEAIKEPVTGNAHARGNGVNPKAKICGANSRIFQDRDPSHPAARKVKQNESFLAAVAGLVDSRNRRSVWTIATAPFPEAHFATFSPELVMPCILAGAPVGSIVIDPFAGSGTTGKVAIELGRKAILIEPKAEYVEMIRRRCQTTIGLPLAI